MRDVSPLAPMPFAKMHGLGNDFVVLDARGSGGAAGAGIDAQLVRRIGDRHFGVGFDQLAVIGPAEDADLGLRFWNTDGSEAGACGNATRCVAARVMDQNATDRLTIRTARGLLTARRADGVVSVNMGAPQRAWDTVPIAHAVPDMLALPLPGSPAAIGMGNPHCVFFVDDAGSAPVTTRGPEVETDPLFPEGTNVEFVQSTGPDRLRVRVWERGAGVTLACGSGACAAAVAARLKGLTHGPVIVDLDGGALTIDWREDGVWMAGPTATVFEGVLDPVWLGAG